jgi:hypothetical protein
MCRLPLPGHAGGMISITNLTKRYGPVMAVDGVTFICRPGTATGSQSPGAPGVHHGSGPGLGA